MRHTLIALLAIVSGLPLSATEQLVSVTPRSLNSWTVVGADKSTIVEAANLTLPASTQISREFSNQAVILRLVTRPVFSESPAEWPILEVGPAAVALLKKDGRDRLVLVINERTSLELPVGAAKQADLATIDLVLAYDPLTGAGLVKLQDELQSFEAEATAKPVEVILSAGAQADWPQDLMELLLLSNEPVADGEKNSSRGNGAAKRLKSALNDLSADGGSGGGSGSGLGSSSGGAAGADDVAQSSKSAAKLEIFTPPSVRRGRADTVRAIIARTKSK